ncbi:hypothetical protein GCM10010129_81210 [Streptomyces fumigatiscleroticus]|nr:hypothetical protein GCM10010129_81210 [Streptomyces fumigatiscleroticus]
MSGAAKTHCPWLSHRFMSTVMRMAGSVVSGVGPGRPPVWCRAAPCRGVRRAGAGGWAGRGQPTGGLKRE